MDQSTLKSFIRDIPDFPKPGILFRDITPLLAEPRIFHDAIDAMCSPWMGQSIDLVVGAEARGFLLGTVVANRLGAGFVPVRKPGKLPCPTISTEYTLEYGTDRLEMHKDAMEWGKRILIVDDLLATGGTVAAVVELIRQSGAKVVGASFLIELTVLQGRKVLSPLNLHSVVQY